jgi:SEL1 protein
MLIICSFLLYLCSADPSTKITMISNFTKAFEYSRRGNHSLAVLQHYMNSINDDVESTMALGYRHLYGINVPKDCSLSIQYYRKSSEVIVKQFDMGYQPPISKVYLSSERGGLYGEGASVTSNSDEMSSINQEDIIQFYQYSAERRDAAAQLVLGQFYYQGTPKTPKNYEKSYRYFLACATQNEKPHSAHAAFNLAQMYLLGQGVEQNNKTAATWVRRAVNDGSHSAVWLLGEMYERGVFSEPNKEKAFEHYKKAAENGVAEAMVKLGKIYLGQQRPDFLGALRYFSEASSRGHIVAIFNLGKMYQRGFGVPKSCNAAVHVLMECLTLVF